MDLILLRFLRGDLICDLVLASPSRDPIKPTKTEILGSFMCVTPHHAERHMNAFT